MFDTMNDFDRSMGIPSPHLFDGLPGAPVVCPDVKPDDLRPMKGVAEHELLHVPIKGSAPVAPGQEAVADGDFLRRGIPLVIARRPNDLARRIIRDHKRTLGSDGTRKEIRLEPVALIPEWIRMLLPDQRVRCCRVQGLKVVCRKWTKCD